MTNSDLLADDSPQWALAIHGGAGDAPSNWTDAKRVARRASMEHALQIGRTILADGGTSIDAVEAVIISLEDDPNFNAGRGAVLTKDGHAELDASIMDGKTMACGAIAGVTTIQNPITTARRVMSNTPHVLLIGRGAESFAASQNVPLVDPNYFLSQIDPNEPDNGMHLGTVGCVALDTHGNLAAGTSTGGTSKKLPGRVGDSPIVGAGTYANNATCAVSGTGVGEEYIRHSVAHDIAAQMRYANRSLSSAVTEIMTERLKPDTGGLICVSHDGTIVMQHNTPAMTCGAADSTGRFDIHLQLEDGGRRDDAAEFEVATQTITNLIQQQARDWNNADIDAFMKIYWKSDDLTFTSSGNVTRGWDATLARYKERYPDPATMGEVTFSELEFLALDGQAIQVIGQWDLQRNTDPVGGLFTLIFRLQPEGWRIVHDHTSVRE